MRVPAGDVRTYALHDESHTDPHLSSRVDTDSCAFPGLIIRVNFLV